MKQVNKNFNQNKKVILLLFLAISILFTGCQSTIDELEEKIEKANTKIENLEKENIKLKELNDELTQQLNETNNKIKEQTEIIKKYEELNSKKEEAINKINKLSHLPYDNKKDFEQKLTSAKNTEDINSIVSSANSMNTTIANEKQVQQKKAKTNSQDTVAKNKTSRSNKSVQTAPKQDNQVLITPTGSKYHSRACGRGTYSPVPLSKAKSMGLTPCKRCY